MRHTICPALSLSLALVLLALVAGCARPRAEARRLPAWVFEASRSESGTRRAAVRHEPHGGTRGRSEASDFVVAALQSSGLRFATDGSVPALWDYLRFSHTPLAPRAVSPGDVLFFQTRAPLPPAGGAPRPVADGCDWPDHAGIVLSADATSGRITFVEARDGVIRRSYVAPDRPRSRRDSRGRVLNTFLRPKLPGELPGESPNFAGEMLCGAARLRP